MTEATRILLGVNIDHVATPAPGRGTLSGPGEGRPGRRGSRRRRYHRAPARGPPAYPGTRRAGAQGSAADADELRDGVTEEMLAFAEEIRPAHSCLVPERREELTTEGRPRRRRPGTAHPRRGATPGWVGSEVSLFIDPDPRQIEASAGSARRLSNCIPVATPTPKTPRSRPVNCSGYARAWPRAFPRPDRQRRAWPALPQCRAGRGHRRHQRAEHRPRHRRPRPVRRPRQAVAEMKALMLAAATKR